MPAMILPSFVAENGEPKTPAELNAPSPDQRCSILPLLGSIVAMAVLPPTYSLKRIFLSGGQASHAEGGFMSLVRFLPSPPSLDMRWMSPPVRPSSLMRPSMKAICLLSGDQTGLAICSLGL